MKKLKKCLKPPEQATTRMASVEKLIDNIAKYYQEYLQGKKFVGRTREFGQKTKFCSILCSVAYGGHPKGGEEEDKYLECFGKCNHYLGQIKTMPLDIAVEQFKQWLEKTDAPHKDDAVKILNKLLEKLKEVTSAGA